MYEIAFHSQHSPVLKELTIPIIDWDSSLCSLEDSNIDYAGLFFIYHLFICDGPSGYSVFSYVCLNSLRKTVYLSDCKYLESYKQVSFNGQLSEFFWLKTLPAQILLGGTHGLSQDGITDFGHG